MEFRCYLFWQYNTILIALVSFYRKCAISKMKIYIKNVHMVYQLVKVIIVPDNTKKKRVLINDELSLADRDLLCVKHFTGQNLGTAVG